MDRVAKLCAFIPPCNVFADVGCDHGYCAQYMLKNGLCKSAIISDISPKSLNKAEVLLADYIKSGVCRAVCCDGLEKIDGADLVMIAGMGGEEIVKILDGAYVPQKFIFQPMKNARKLREYLIKKGCALTADDMFFHGGKYYFVIVGENSGNCPPYSEAELEFGRNSLKNPLIKGYLEEEISKKRGYLQGDMAAQNKKNIQSQIEFLTGVYNCEIR